MTSRIVVVDNEPLIRGQICRFLKNWFDVVEVGTLKEAKEVMTGEVRVLIQDLIFENEPDEDAFELIARYCGAETACEAIAITGRIAQADLRRVADSGAYCFFKKPVDLDELLIATWAALQRAERRGVFPPI